MATIIRRESPKLTPSAPEVRRVAFDLQDIAKHGDDYVRSIRAEAARIIQDANAEAAELRKKAEQAGRAVAEQAIEKMLEEKIGKQMRSLATSARRSCDPVTSSPRRVAGALANRRD